MSEFTNRRGVNLVESESLKLEWFFREQATSDQGIDAHVEKAPIEVGTGRLLAIQIKTGESYFDEPTEDGWVFRFGAKKAKLWLGHALPVLVVLVDLDVDGGVAYWQHISSRTVVSTGKDFKVEVPRSQVLSEADAEWTHIASGLESQAVDRYDFAITQLPPSVRQALENRPATERSDAAVLALHLAEGRSNPRGTTLALLATSPGWIERDASQAWQAIASCAAEHDLLDLSAEAFERAASATPEGHGRLLAAAALHMMPSDRQRCEELLTQAEATGHAPLIVAVVKALLEHPEGDAGPRRIDPMLLTDSEAVRTSQVAQSLLSDQATRAGDLDAACYHAGLALDADPENSAVMVSRAETLIRRSNSHKQHIDDLPTAIQLLERALDQRRTWAGPALDALVPLAQAYGLNGQFEMMLERCLPSPQGTASPDEAEHPRIRRNALYAAELAGRRDLVDDLAAKLDESVQDRIARLRTGTLQLTPEEQCALWAEELTRAIADTDYEAVATSAIALASLGQDERSRLVPFVERSIIPETLLELATALVTAKTDLDAALPALRSLARRNMVAAEHLILKLTAAARYTEAAQACSALYEYSGNPYFLIIRAQCLLDGKADDAEDSALTAANSTSGYPTERTRLFSYLGAQAADRDEWDIAETHLTEALRLRVNPAPVEVWRVVLAQVNQGKLRRVILNTISPQHTRL